MATDTAKLLRELLSQSSKSGREKRTEVCQVPEMNHPSQSLEKRWKNGHCFCSFWSLPHPIHYYWHCPFNCTMTCFEGRNSRTVNARLKSPYTVFVWAWSKRNKSFQIWGTATELLVLEDSKMTVHLNSRSHVFFLPSSIFARRFYFGISQSISYLIGR